MVKFSFSAVGSLFSDSHRGGLLTQFSTVRQEHKHEQ